MNADQLRPTNIPGEAGHNVYGVSTADADGHHAEAAGIGRVGVGADHHAAGEGVVFQNNLVDDAGAGLPEAATVFGAYRLQEVVDLLVVVEGGQEIAFAVLAGLDEVIAVRGRRHRHFIKACGLELQPGHLGGGILHGHPVRAEVDVADAALHVG